MTLAEQLFEIAEKKGHEEGHKEGYKSIVRRLIELKFGALSNDAMTRLEAADETALERYSERVLTATRVEDVLGD